MARPDTITNPILKRATAPSPTANNKGIRPEIMAAVVIRIGRNRMLAASLIASILLSIDTGFMAYLLRRQSLCPWMAMIFRPQAISIHLYCL